jgi:hypothetical protein
MRDERKQASFEVHPSYSLACPAGERSLKHEGHEEHEEKAKKWAFLIRVLRVLRVSIFRERRQRAQRSAPPHPTASGDAARWRIFHWN